jgi:hypothetical protein
MNHPTNVTVKRGDRLAARKVGTEMVILSADDSSLFVLNEVGTAIWEAADGRTTLDAIAGGLCREFDVDRETALRDVADFVSALAAAGVLSTSEGATS